MKFLVDSQLPSALARFLASRGVDCQHVIDLGLADAADARIWEHASRTNCVVISKDADFLYLANAPSAKARFIWIRLGNCHTKKLIGVMEKLWPKIEEALNAGDRIVEVR